jgi:protein-disulfide isomerase
MNLLKAPITSEDHIQGSDDAIITLVEYGDYQCPECGRVYPIIKQVQKHFDKQLRFVYRHYPLKIHPYAEIAAETAEFADTFDHFWEMHDRIYENQTILSTPLLLGMTESLGLSVKELELAIKNHLFEPKIKINKEGGIASGVKGTPTFFINNQIYEGPLEFSKLVHAIEAVFVG